MAAPVFQAAGTPGGNTANLVLAWPVHQADDIGLLFVETLSSDAAPAAPTGWAEVPDSPQTAPTVVAANGTRLSIFWKRAASSAEGDATVVDVGNHQIGGILTFRGCIATGDPWDVTAGDIQGTLESTSVSVPGDTTTVADCLIVAAGSAGTDTSTDQFSAWANADLTDVTEREDFFAVTANGGGFGVATGVKATAGAFGATTATLAAAALQGRIMVALKPPAGGATTPQAIAATSAFTPVLASVAFYFRTLGVASTFGAVLARVASYFRTLPVALTATAALTRVTSYFRTLAVTSAQAIVLTPAKLFIRALAVTSVFGAALVRALVFSKALAVTSPAGVALTRVANYFRALPSSGAFTPALTRRLDAFRTLAVASPFGAVLTRAASLYRALSVTSPLDPALTKANVFTVALQVVGSWLAGLATKKESPRWFYDDFWLGIRRGR